MIKIGISKVLSLKKEIDKSSAGRVLSSRGVVAACDARTPNERQAFQGPLARA